MEHKTQLCLWGHSDLLKSINLFVPFTLLSTLVILTSGCSGANSDSAPVSRVQDIQQGLAPGEFELEFKGQVVTVGPAQADREPAEFWPQRITQNRQRNDGMGGRQAVDTSNATGPYRLQLWQEISRLEGEPGTGRVWIQLPPDAKAGTTYTLYDANRSGNGDAYGGVVGAQHDWSISSNLGGWISVAEIGSHLTAAFHLHNNAELDSENRLDVTGRVNRIPFRPRTEADFRITANGETVEAVSGMIRQDRPDRYLIIVQRYFSFEFDGPPQPGTYEFGTRRGSGLVHLSLDDHRFEEVDGSLELSLDGETFTATFQATTRGAESVTLEGKITHLPPSIH
jgi:hypothetical protein